MKLQSYDKVIGHLFKNKRTPNLLLGNGFSMAYDPDIFSYNALHGFVEKIEDELLSKLFGIVKTKNFEMVMQQLDNFCELIEAFGSDEVLLDKVRQASEHLKRTLLAAVKELHPEHVFKISEEECEHCANFLSPYLEFQGNVFSANYDILLYWVLLRSELKNHNDGFGRDRLDDEEDHDTDPEFSELRWGPNRENQKIHHVHGTLPIFDTGIEIIKEQYDGSSLLLENIETRVSNGDYPVFVASGNSDEKLSHIMHNRYLSFCYDALSNIEGSLVTFGFNFGPSDHHIIKAINLATKHKKEKEFRDKLWSIYIGVYSEENRQHIESIRHLFKCKVNLFDAKTARVWR